MPSANGIEVMKFLTAHDEIRYPDFSSVFPNMDDSVIIDLAKYGYLENARPLQSIPWDITGETTIYEAYRLSDKGREHLEQMPILERRQRSADVRSNITIAIAALALILSVISLSWQMYTYLH